MVYPAIGSAWQQYGDIMRKVARIVAYNDCFNEEKSKYRGGAFELIDAGKGSSIECDFLLSKMHIVGTEQEMAGRRAMLLKYQATVLYC